MLEALPCRQHFFCTSPTSCQVSSPGISTDISSTVGWLIVINCMIITTRGLWAIFFANAAHSTRTTSMWQCHQTICLSIVVWSLCVFVQNLWRLVKLYIFEKLTASGMWKSMFTFAQMHVLAAISISIWPYWPIYKILCSGQRYVWSQVWKGFFWLFSKFETEILWTSRDISIFVHKWCFRKHNVNLMYFH